MFIAEPLVPRSRAPGIIFLRRTAARGGRVEARWVKERDFFSFAFALRCLIMQSNMY